MGYCRQCIDNEAESGSECCAECNEVNSRAVKLERKLKRVFKVEREIQKQYRAITGKDYRPF